MSKKPWSDKESFEEMWERCDYSLSEMAKNWPITLQAIAYWRDKHGFKKPKKPWKREENLRKLYRGENMTLAEVADELGTNPSTVSKWLRRFGIETRKPGNGDFHRKLHPNVTMKNNGYIEVRASNGYEEDRVLLHRLLAIAKYGFEEVCDMDVHHKNNIPWDNRPDNIELITEEEHGRLHGRWKPN